MTLVGCLLEYNAIFVFYGRVLKLAILSSVTGTIVLNFDYDTFEFAVRKIQDIFHKRRVTDTLFDFQQSKRGGRLELFRPPDVTDLTRRLWIPAGIFPLPRLFRVFLSQQKKKM